MLGYPPLGVRPTSRAPARTALSTTSALPGLLTRTPHIGYVTRDEYEIQFADIFDQIVAYAAGAPINVVNPEVLRVGGASARQ